MKRLPIDERVQDILARAADCTGLTTEDALYLMDNVDVNSLEMALLCATADRLTREQTGNIGEVFAQVGVNYNHCPLKCQFCVFTIEDLPRMELADDEVVARAVKFAEEGANAVSLMVTADYPFERFLELGRRTRAKLPPEWPLVANYGDFGPEQARDLLEAGFTAVYHVIRLGEGVDTPIPIQQRIRTLRAAREVGLDVTYCLEPIGPEHSNRELLHAIQRGEEFTPTSMATMRRIAVPGTPLAERGQITEVEQAKLQAITTLIAWSWENMIMMSAHEPSMLFLRSGANRATAETGVNPRDVDADTSRNRGRSVADCQRMLVDAGHTLRVGPSPALQGPYRKVHPREAFRSARRLLSA
jgi:biotin synthase